MKCLFNMKIVEGGFFIDTLNESNIVTSKLYSISIKIYEEFRNLLILFSFPKRWNGLVVVVGNSISSSNTLEVYGVFSQD